MSAKIQRQVTRAQQALEKASALLESLISSLGDEPEGRRAPKAAGKKPGRPAGKKAAGKVASKQRGRPAKASSEDEEDDAPVRRGRPAGKKAAGKAAGKKAAGKKAAGKSAGKKAAGKPTKRSKSDGGFPTF